MNVKERFLNYVSFPTNSDDKSDSVPSTDGQRILAKYIRDELIEIGLTNVVMDQNSYVYGFIPASEGCEDKPALGFIAHMDTSSDVKGDGINPSVVHYEGGDISLASGEAIRLKAFPFLREYIGQDIIVTDGTTLLGSDDKAGIAEIVTMCEELISNHEIKHRGVAVCFTPDEEIGRGTDYFDFSKFLAKEAYTVDGGEIGEIEYENFNGASVSIEINGLNIHPGSAKNKMKNAVLLANEFISAMPPAEVPGHTEGYEGFYHIGGINGNVSRVNLSMIIRDHDMIKFEKRKAFVSRLTDYFNAVYGEGTFILTMRDSYYNMKEKILDHMDLIHNAENAMRNAGIEPRIIPIRGGTDGAMLSYKGLPCPNLSTGGANCHGIHEFVPVPSLEKMVEVLKNLVII